MRSIAIIGKGFSGLATAYHLMQQTCEPINICFFEKAVKMERRIAFSTNCPLHLLNVPAGKMGLPADDPEHFVKWLNSCANWRQLSPSFADLTVENASFLPRMLYGYYLDEMEKELAALAKKKKSVIKDVCEEAIDADQHQHRWILKTCSKKEMIVDQLVLAISSPWTQPISYHAQPNYYHAPWPEFTQMELAQPNLKRLGPLSEVALIGSGLTMLDMLATLHYCGFKGNVTVISGKNFIPLLWGEFAPLMKIDPAMFYAGALTALKAFKKLCQSVHWRQALDAIRPHAQHIWQQWAVVEKKRFLKYLFGFWNAHRHRAPEYALHFVDIYKRANRLRLIKGTVESISRTDQQPQLIVKRTETKKKEHYAFNLIINCTGPSFTIRQHTSPLIQNLLQKQLISPDEMGLGIKNDRSAIHAIGSLLFGSLFETTAVPEIRKEASAIASQILSFTLKG